MRTSILTAGFLGLFVAGCAGELSGTGDDTGTPETCGNGTVDSGESCDDTNTANGDGCSSSCQVESTGGTPKIAASVDKMSVPLQLGNTTTVTLNLMSIDGFVGDATIAASLVDGAGVAISGVTVTGPTTVTLVSGGSAPAAYTITVPSTATGVDIVGTLKFDVTSSAAPVSMAANVNISAIFTVVYAAGLGTGPANHPGKLTSAVTVRRGAKIRFMNMDAITHITHGQGAGFPHEDQTNGGKPGSMYEVSTTPVAPGTVGTLGCHSHPGAGNETYASFTVMP